MTTGESPYLLTDPQTASLAEEVGFEPTVPRCGRPVFETGLQSPQVITGKELGETPPALVPSVVPSVPKDGSEFILEPSFGGVNDLGLSEVVRVWRDLPEHIKQTILTLTRAVRKEPSHPSPTSRVGRLNKL
jgi:hypothetical protein